MLRSRLSSEATDTPALCINTQNIYLDNVTKARRQHVLRSVHHLKMHAHCAKTAKIQLTKTLDEVRAQHREGRSIHADVILHWNRAGLL